MLTKFIFRINTHDIIIIYDKLYHTYINFFNKTISKYLLLLLLSFLRVFPKHFYEFFFHHFFGQNIH